MTELKLNHLKIEVARQKIFDVSPFHDESQVNLLAIIFWGFSKFLDMFYYITILSFSVKSNSPH